MGCGCNRTFSGGRRRLKRKQSKRRNTKKHTKVSKKRNYKKRSYRNRKMRRMSGGSGIVDPLSAGLHDAASKLTSNSYVPSGAHIQPAGQPYQDDRNPYYV